MWDLAIAAQAAIDQLKENARKAAKVREEVAAVQRQVDALKPYGLDLTA